MPPGTRPSGQVYTADALERKRMEELRRQLEQSWIAQGNAPYSSPTSSTQINLGSPNYAIPSGPMTTVTKRPAQIGTINPNIIRGEGLEALRQKSTTRVLSKGLNLSQSTDLDPKFRGANALSDIEAAIAALANKPDIPGRWESPYSQDYLNQLGDRLAGAGSAAQAAFQAAKNDIASGYQQGEQGRESAMQRIVQPMQEAGQNIGVNYGASQQGQQAAADMAYLSQMAEANKATDLSTNDKLGVVANQFGANLGSQAREGLLTPKQWVEGQSGMSSGDRLMADFLMNKYNQELEGQRLSAEQAAAAKNQGSMLSGFSDFAKTLTQGAGDEYRQNYPDVVQGLAGIKDSRTMDEANRIWNITGDPAEAVKYLETQYKEDNPNFFTQPNAPVWMPSSAPLGAVDSPAYRAAQQRQSSYQSALNDYKGDQQDYQMNQAMFKYLLDFFNQYNPNRTGVNTSKTITNSTSEKYS